MFYRFRNEMMVLDLNESKLLCAWYYILNSMERLPNLTLANFQTDKLKALLPDSKWHLIDDPNDLNNFPACVFFCIKDNFEKMESSSETMGRTSSSTISAKIELISRSILTLAFNNKSWSTMFFEVINYEPTSLPGACPNLMLGVNSKSVMILRKKRTEPLLEI
jgi:hypothetical protein